MIDLDRIIKIESDGNPKAYNWESNRAGLCQLSMSALQDWNANHHKTRYTKTDLFDGRINRKIAKWYLTERIPALLVAAKLPVNDKNILLAYCTGVHHVANPSLEALEVVELYYREKK